jgi:hypothetical protein
MLHYIVNMVEGIDRDLSTFPKDLQHVELAAKGFFLPSPIFLLALPFTKSTYSPLPLFPSVLIFLSSFLSFRNFPALFKSPNGQNEHVMAALTTNGGDRKRLPFLFFYFLLFVLPLRATFHLF